MNNGEGCEELLKFTELDQLMIHHDIFYKKPTISSYKKCKNCKITVLKDSVQNCLLNYFKDYEVRLSQIIEMLFNKIETIKKSDRKQQIQLEINLKNFMI